MNALELKIPPPLVLLIFAVAMWFAAPLTELFWAEYVDYKIERGGEFE
jgi:hypothetical protein